MDIDPKVVELCCICCGIVTENRVINNENISFFKQLNNDKSNLNKPICKICYNKYINQKSKNIANEKKAKKKNNNEKKRKNYKDKNKTNQKKNKKIFFGEKSTRYNRFKEIKSFVEKKIEEINSFIVKQDSFMEISIDLTVFNNKNIQEFKNFNFNKTNEKKKNYFLKKIEKWNSELSFEWMKHNNLSREKYNSIRKTFKELAPLKEINEEIKKRKKKLIEEKIFIFSSMNDDIEKKKEAESYGFHYDIKNSVKENLQEDDDILILINSNYNFFLENKNKKFYDKENNTIKINTFIRFSYDGYCFKKSGSELLVSWQFPINNICSYSSINHPYKTKINVYGAIKNKDVKRNWKNLLQILDFQIEELKKFQLHILIEEKKFEKKKERT
jgi:hypothetical protein